ncbi:hypothetical protein K502DRAFT_322730 [Neoconidiobolus thromboides FSU 785]|nr:hypothetical protein K502DRAFT_322730 [Neoconidiobolus thromboides FSU 785]
MNNSETEPLRANNEHDSMLIEETLAKHNKRGCCGTKKSKIIWGISISTILLLMGLLTYFFFPRYPKVGFYGVEIDNVNQPGSHKILGGLSKKNHTVNLALTMYVYANSTLFFDLKVDKIDVEGYMKLNNGDYVHVGNGHLKAPIIIPKRSSFYKFEMPFLITYDTQNKAQESSEAFKQFLNKCGIDGQPKKNIQIKYIARAWIPLLSWTGYVSKFIKEIEFPCPLKLDLITNIRKAFGFLFG